MRLYAAVLTLTLVAGCSPKPKPTRLPLGKSRPIRIMSEDPDRENILQHPKKGRKDDPQGICCDIHDAYMAVAGH